MFSKSSNIILNNILRFVFIKIKKSTGKKMKNNTKHKELYKKESYYKKERRLIICGFRPILLHKVCQREVIRFKILHVRDPQ